MALCFYSQIYISSLFENKFWLYGSTHSIAGMLHFNRVIKYVQSLSLCRLVSSLFLRKGAIDVGKCVFV